MNNNVTLYVPFGILALSAISIWYAIKYARINVLHSIQKLILEKAKDCNAMHSKALEKWISSPRALGMEPLYFNFAPIISEVLISVKLLDSSLLEFKQSKRRTFFLRQFWIQLSPDIRDYIISYKIPSGMSSKEIENTKEVMNAFKPFF